MVKRRRKPNLILILFLLVIVTTAYFLSYSKFVTLAKYEDKTYVAQFVIDSNINEKLSLKLDAMKPGDIKGYMFTVSNSKNTITGDVPIDYIFTVKKSNNLPITISIFDNDDLTTNLLINETKTESKDVLMSDKINMEAGNSKIKIYKIEIAWKTSNQSYYSEKYVDELDYIDFYINANQLEPAK